MAAIRVKSHAIISTLDLNIYAKKCILRKNTDIKIYMKERDRKKIKHLLSMYILPSTS